MATKINLTCTPLGVPRWCRHRRDQIISDSEELRTPLDLIDNSTLTGNIDSSEEEGNEGGILAVLSNITDTM